ncbi:MAG: NADH-quinone oxidoreductase subunit H [Anaerolineae bacterium]|nr:NADH-quinone oxidoreductase subunit H [Anaerolineae bacterium]
MEPTYLACTGACETIRVIVLSLVIFLSLTVLFAYTTLLERRFVALIQNRLGPNRVGPFGLFQPVADGIKLIFKEDITPRNADRVVFWLAPVITAVPALVVLAVVPLAPSIPLWVAGKWYVIPLSLADVNVGILYVLAVTSIAVYGITLAGWSSANKYSLLGGIRASAQMVSYELCLGTAMAVPILIAGTMSFGKIVDAQHDLWWFVLHNPLAALILMIAMLAEVNRAPFDLPEAEQELTAGYHTEYSGMKFALFFMAEYIKMVAVSLIAFSLFFGGFGGPGVDSDFARGELQITNHGSAAVVIPARTLVHNDAEQPEYQVLFETLADVTVPAGGAATAVIQAHMRSVGLVGNVPADTLTAMTPAHPADLTVTNPAPTTGGGQAFVLGPLLGGAYLMAKLVLSLLAMVWIRGTFPRFRYDQLMGFGWKVMLPLAFVAVAWTAVALVTWDETGNTGAYAAVVIAQYAAIGAAIVIGVVRSYLRQRTGATRSEG